MKRAAIVLALGFVTPACAVFSTAQRSPAVTAAAQPEAAPKDAPEAAVKVAREDDDAPVDPRKVGDFYVHRFSGSYAKSPLTLTEQVVAKEDGLWVIDYTFEQASGTTKLRVRMDPWTDQVARVSKLEGGAEVSVSLASYEKLMDRTSFTADSNDGELATEHGTCLVGASELDCETKSYKVRVGDKDAKLTVAHADSVPGSDISGDITDSDGSLIYRSELVEMGNADSPRAGVASR